MTTDMRRKICKKCGKVFDAPTTYTYYCSECHKQAKLDTYYRPRTCRICGITFDGPPRACYCPDCREIARRNTAKRARKNKGSRPLGSVDLCARCGQPYIVNSGQQKYCPNCAEIARAETIRTKKREYYAQNKEKFIAHKREMREGAKVCVVCGNPIIYKTPRVTCSDECAKEHKRMLQKRVDANRGRRKPPKEI